jgi:hypothetical protein
MNETLKSLVAKNGLAAVLASLGDLVREEAASLEDAGDPADAGTVEKLEGIAGRVVKAAAELDAILEPVG